MLEYTRSIGVVAGEPVKSMLGQVVQSKVLISATIVTPSATNAENHSSQIELKHFTREPDLAREAAVVACNTCCV